MKNRKIVMLLTLLLSLAICVPVFAETDAGNISGTDAGSVVIQESSDEDGKAKVGSDSSSASEISYPDIFVLG